MKVSTDLVLRYTRYGARPLRRTIQHHVLDPLAEELLSGAFRTSRHIKAHLDREGLRFEAA